MKYLGSRVMAKSWIPKTHEIIFFFTKKIQKVFHFSRSPRNALKTCASFSIERVLSPRAQELLLTPSELGDRALRSGRHAKLLKITENYGKLAEIHFTKKNSW